MQWLLWELIAKSLSMVLYRVSVIMMVSRLHFQMQITVLSKHVRGVELARVRLERASGLVPATTVESVEVIAPVELELLVLGVPLMNLNVVVKGVPGHIERIQIFAPRMESGSPEVHAEGLRLVEVVNCSVLVPSGMSDLNSINDKSDISRCPFNLISVPVIERVEAMGVVMRLDLIFAVAVDHVHRKRVSLDRGHDLNVDLVPVLRGEVRPIEIGEERGNCASAVRGLHPRHELAIREVLVGRHRAGSEEVGLSDTHDREQS